MKLSSKTIKRIKTVYEFDKNDTKELLKKLIKFRLDYSSIDYRKEIDILIRICRTKLEIPHSMAYNQIFNYLEKG